MKALVLDAEHRTAQVKTIPKPVPQRNEVLELLNPLVRLSQTAGAFEPGARVGRFLQGASSVSDRPGAFAEYLVCPRDLVWKVPEHVGLETAAAVNFCSLTAAQALFYGLGTRAPFHRDEQNEQGLAQTAQAAPKNISVFVYGASTSVGLYAAQLVRRAAEASWDKVRLIGSASRKHFEMLKAEPYSYDDLVDYRTRTSLSRFEN
ncbi:uncharacterized protein A1O9_02114 [Exophiala aquamarina CBS 119918]|uniref:Enoyl reductase (ER) domain-containing protein n=1 Tax=Exophiala aquamarina CBS 119918 TaxID=1182545 RepID=A0A072PMI0_9EURO|nr:uncharacterized protein A1O9_02114 [Exophiala aquamarina CBS 119918]KEF60553.1 hypothetical protein A1O9_02114 [Exophiala aquamarina CBS 119918]